MTENIESSTTAVPSEDNAAQASATSEAAFAAEENEPPSAEAGSEDSEKDEKQLKPIWSKLLKGIKARKTNQTNVVWGSMIKKLNRIKAYQKSTPQEAVISDMFNVGSGTETSEEAIPSGEFVNIIKRKALFLQ